MKLLYFHFLVLGILLPGLCWAQADTLSIYFENDEYQFEIIELESLNHAPLYKNINIQAFADSNASDNYNQKLSEKRAYFTYYQLLKIGVSIENIDLVIGKGEISTITNTQDLNKCRRVDIIYQQIEESAKPKADPEIIADIKLEEDFSEAEVGNTVKINNIHFQPGTHLILAESKPELDQLVHILNKNKQLKIEIQGHICCQYDGGDGFDLIAQNNQLSVNRAYAVYRHLIDQGIEASRLSFKGFGSSKKIYQNEKNDAQKIANRRVEIYILEK